MSTRSLSQGTNLSDHEEVVATEQGGEQVEGKPYLLGASQFCQKAQH